MQRKKSGAEARKYKENRDSFKIATLMTKEEIDEEIVDFINQIVKATGNQVIESVNS